MSIVLVDDHEIFRAGLRAELTARGMRVVGEAADGDAACEIIERTTPDVAIIDVMLPGRDGILVARQVRERVPDCRLLMLSAFGTHAAEAFAAGAHGYALKDQPPSSIVDAVRAVARGERYVAPKIAGSGGASSDPLRQLSSREREVFRLVVDGMSTDRIATTLGIAPKTVESHRASINRKLDVHSSAELVRFAATRGMLPRS
jgi:DNA-binding NarL/FixJ family response regulator